jgi:hypothetical protein
MTVQNFDVTTTRDPGYGGRPQDRNLSGCVMDYSDLHRLTEDMVPEKNRDTFRATSTDKLDRDIRSNPDWYGGISSLAQMNEMLTKGWASGSQRVKAMSAELANAPDFTGLDIQNMRRALTYSDAGDEVDCDRFYAGQYDTMWRTTTRRAAGMLPTISIVFSWGGLASRTTEEMFWSGAAAVIAADILEEHGFSVELIAMSIAQQGGMRNDAVVGMRLKSSDMPLRFGPIATAACHAGAFRTHCFRWRTTSRHRVTTGMGSTQNAADYDLSPLPLEGEPLVLPLAYSRGQAVSNIKQVLECEYLAESK